MISAGASGLRRNAGAREGRALWRYVAAAWLFNAMLALATLPGAAVAETSTRILALGDSLTAGYGLAAEDAFPAQLERALTAKGYDAQVLNAGVSGDTTAGGLARLDWSLTEKPDYAIVALGGNDGLRGIDPAATRANLAAIIGRLKTAGVRVLLAGMYAPPNLGREYGAEFNRLFPDLARAHEVALYPFLLEGVAANPELNQPDGIHPNARGVAVMVKMILPAVEALIGRH